MKYPTSRKLTLIDGFLKVWQKLKRARTQRPQEITSILLCNFAHHGDVILTTALLPVLKRYYPHAVIGMLVSTACKKVIEGHPLVDHIHCWDHFKLNRSNEDTVCKMNRHRTSYRLALKQIQAQYYTVAIDCRFHYPNTARLLYSAQIPMRVGFTTAGLSPLLTHRYPWDAAENCPATEAFGSLLTALNINAVAATLKPSLPQFPLYADKMHAFLGNSRKNIVIHMGAGDAKKLWPLAQWKKLAVLLIHAGYALVVTGLGEEEQRQAQALCQGLHNTLNACNALKWQELVELIRGADLLVGVDSAAGHVAAAVATPAVLLYTSIHPLKIWSPVQENSIDRGFKEVRPKIQVITHAPPCAPCFRGCSTMECIRTIDVRHVYTAIRTAFECSDPHSSQGA